MQQRTWKAEETIESGAQALREQAAPPADPQGVIAALRKPAGGRRLVVTGATLAVCAAGALAVVLWPRVGAAAELGKVASAFDNAQQRVETHYVANDKGVYELEMKLVVDKDKAAIQEKGAATQVWSNDRLTTYFVNYALVRRAQRPEWIGRVPDLDKWLRQAVLGSIKKKVVRESDRATDKMNQVVQFDLARYDFDVVVDDAVGKKLNGHVRLDVDLSTSLPYRVVATLDGFQPTMIRYRYVPQELISELRIDASGPYYDIDAQRRQIVLSFSNPVATADAGDTTVLLHEAVIDHEGNLTLIYSNVPELPAKIEVAKVLDPSMLSDQPTLSLMPQTTRDGVLTSEPVVYQGRRVALLSLRLKPEFASIKTIKDLRLPLVVNGQEQWAEFHDVPLMRTGDSLALLAPRNVPFFVEPPTTEGAPTATGG